MRNSQAMAPLAFTTFTLTILSILLLSAIHSECKANRKQKPPKLCDSSSNVSNNCTTTTTLSTSNSNLTTNMTTEAPSVATTTLTTTTLAPSTTSAKNLIAKTTDVIYKAFSSVFGYSNTTTQVPLNPTTPAPIPTGQTSTMATTITTESEETSTTTRRSRNKKTTTTTIEPTTTTTTTELDTITPTDSSLDEQMSTSTPISSDSLTTTTLGPTEQLYTTETPTTTITTTSGQALNSLAANLTGLLGDLIRSLDSLRESQANRSTRLAPEPDFGDFALHSGRLVVAPNNQLASSDDVHLLCKLLQRHLGANITSLTSALATTITPLASTTTQKVSTTSASTSTSTSTSTTTTTSTTSTTTSTTPEPQITKPANEKELFVNDLDRLNETEHGSYLLESILNFQETSAKSLNSTRRSAERLLTELYNAAADSKRVVETLDYDSEGVGAVGDTMLVRSSSKFFPNYSKVGETLNHLHYVYWLLERSNQRLRLVNWREASEMLDRLEHRLIERQLGLSKATMATDSLVSAFNSSQSSWNSSTSQDHKHERQPPRTIDDSLIPSSNGDHSTPRPKASASGLQLLLDKFSQASFMDNLQLYLILFILVTLVIVLCLAVPLMCCCRGAETGPPAGAPVDELSPPASGRQRGRRRLAAGHATGQAPTLLGAGSGADNLDKSSDSIWRKLSSSTTTLVKDESHEIRGDGTVSVPVIREHQVLRRGQQATLEPLEEPAGSSSSAKKHQFEWYSFEDRLEEVVTRAGSSRANARDIKPSYTDAKASADLVLVDFKNRQETRNSDTLTKSELVMLKEKLVPIARLDKGSLCGHHVAATQTSQDSSGGLSLPDYVNCPKTANKLSQTTIEQQQHSQQSSSSSSSQTTRRGGPRSSLASHYIDSTTEPSCSLATNLPDHLAGQQEQHERQAKMRHVELPTRARSKVELIRAELDRLEQADRQKQQQHEITYKRYEI